MFPIIEFNLKSLLVVRSRVMILPPPSPLSALNIRNKWKQGQKSHVKGMKTKYKIPKTSFFPSHVKLCVKDILGHRNI
eukprot:c32397_g1_i1 orf=25-258(-)